MGILTYQYGAKRPHNWEAHDDGVAQLLVAFWNRLVDIENDFLQLYRGVIRTADPGLEAEEQAVTLLKSAANDGTTLDRKELRERAQRLAARRKVLRDQCQADLAQLDQNRRAHIKEARQQSMLWWPHYQTVLSDFDTARRATFQRGGRLHHRALHSSGLRFEVPFQNGISVEDLLAGKSNLVTITPLGGVTTSRDKQRALLRLAIDRTRVDDKKSYRYLEVPVELHRPLPEDATIKSIALQNHGTLLNPDDWKVSITLDVPERYSPAAMHRCGLDLGWRMTEHGLRVGFWVGSDGPKGEILLPQEWINKARHLDSLRTAISASAKVVLNACCACYEGDLPPELSALTAQADRPSKALVILCKRLQRQDWAASDALRPAAQLLRSWWESNRRGLVEAENLQRKLENRRKTIYQVEAKRLAERYGTIVVEALDLRRLAKLQAKHVPLAVQRCLRWAAISELRTWLKHQTTKHHGVLKEVPAMDTTQRCAACGHINHQSTLQPIMVCEKCETVWDQDENAGTNLMRT